MVMVDKAIVKVILVARLAILAAAAAEMKP